MNVSKDEYDEYIGRTVHTSTRTYPASKWANPFSSRGQTKEEKEDSLLRYELYIRSCPDLVKSLPELLWKRVGCWCKPNICHGDVLRKLCLWQKQGIDVSLKDEDQEAIDFANYCAEFTNEDFMCYMEMHEGIDEEIGDQERHHDEAWTKAQLAMIDPAGREELEKAARIQSTHTAQTDGKEDSSEKLETLRATGTDHPSEEEKVNQERLKTIYSNLFWSDVMFDDEITGMVEAFEKQDSLAKDLGAGLQPAENNEMPSGKRKGQEVHLPADAPETWEDKQTKESMEMNMKPLTLEEVEKSTPGSGIDLLCNCSPRKKLLETIKCKKEHEIGQQNTATKLPNRSSLKDKMFRLEQKAIRPPSIWSILTDVVTYPEHSKEDDEFILKPCNKSYSTREKFWKSARTTQNKESGKEEYYQDDSRLDDRYSTVVSQVVSGFQPNVDLCATYLYTQEGALEFPTRSNFMKGYFGMTRNCTSTGRLLDDSQIILMVLNDSGETKPIIRRKFLEETEFMKHYPRYSVTKQSVVTANGSLMYVTECVKFLISLGGHVFEIIAYIADMADDMDLILGSKAFIELEADLEISKQRVTFVKRSLPVYCKRRIQVKPGEQKTMLLHCPNLPQDFATGNAIVKLDVGRKDKLPQTLPVYINNGQFTVELHAGKEAGVAFEAGDFHGILDLRSVGYFYQARDTLSYSMSIQGTADFLTEKDSAKLIQEAVEHTTRLRVSERFKEERSKNDQRTPVNEFDPHQEIDPEELKRLKVDPNDPWPWLDEDDPRRFKTDEQLIDELVDLSSADLSF